MAHTHTELRLPGKSTCLEQEDIFCKVAAYNRQLAGALFAADHMQVGRKLLDGDQGLPNQICAGHRQLKILQAQSMSQTTSSAAECI